MLLHSLNVSGKLFGLSTGHDWNSRQDVPSTWIPHKPPPICFFKQSSKFNVFSVTNSVFSSPVDAYVTDYDNDLQRCRKYMLIKKQRLPENEINISKFAVNCHILCELGRWTMKKVISLAEHLTSVSHLIKISEIIKRKCEQSLSLKLWQFFPYLNVFFCSLNAPGSISFTH